MQIVIEKALNKARQRNLNIRETAALIEDFLDANGLILGLMGPPAPEEGPAVWGRNAAPSVATAFDTFAQNHHKQPEPSPMPPPPRNLLTPPKFAVNQVLGAKPDPNSPAWKSEDLFQAIRTQKLEFSLTPIGWDEEVSFRGTPVQDPKGMKGVGVAFKCVDAPMSEEIPVFFPVTQPEIDLEGTIEELKISIAQLLRKREGPISNNSQQLRQDPEDFFRAAGFSASV